MTVTLETIHEDILSLKREFGGVVSYFEEDKMELSEEIKKQIDDSRKTPIFKMLTQEEVEKEFLRPLRFCGTQKQFYNYGSCHRMYPLVL